MKSKGIPQNTVIRSKVPGATSSSSETSLEGNDRLESLYQEFQNKAFESVPKPPLVEELTKESSQVSVEKVRVPEHQIVHRGVVDITDYTCAREKQVSRPKELLIRVMLPGVVMQSYFNSLKFLILIGSFGVRQKALISMLTLRQNSGSKWMSMGNTH
jgi:hypothetical protein